MGCDIHSFAERRNSQKSKWEKVTNTFSLDEWEKQYYKKDKGDNPFDWRSYSMFAFLADVRNYDHCTPLSEPRGLPNDISDEVKEEYGEGWDCHSASYLTLKELMEFDYDQTFCNRRISRTVDNFTDGAAIAEEGEGKIMSYRENLGDMFFVHLHELKELGNPEDVRIVFWFDN